MPSLDEIFAPPAAKASLDDIFGVRQPGTSAEESKPNDARTRYLSAERGSEERKSALQEMSKEEQEKTAQQYERERSTGEAYQRVGAPLGKYTPSLETAGGAVGGLVSAGGGPGTAVGGAALGGAAGEAADQLLRRAAGVPAPASAGEAATDIATSGARQGAYEAGGRAILGSANRALAPIADDTTRAIFQQGERAGIPATADQVIDAASRYNPISSLARVIRGVGEDVKTMRGTFGTRAQEGLTPETRQAIEARVGQETAGLPAQLDPDLAGQAHKAYVEALVKEGRKVVDRKYGAVAAFARADPNAVAAPSSLLATARKWQRDLNKGLGDPESQKWLDRVFERVAQSKSGKLHFTELDAIRKDIGEGGFKPSMPGMPTPNTAMLRELYTSAARDMERVPNQVLKDMARDARTAYMENVAPFKPGKDRILHNLVGKSPEDYVRLLSGPRAAQYVRELKQVQKLHPNVTGLDQIESQTLNHLIDASRGDIPFKGKMERMIDGRKLYTHAARMAPVLDELKGPGYAKELQNLAQVIKAAQQTPKGALGRLGFEIGGLLYHPTGVGVPVLIGMTGMSELMKTRAGVRWLAEGVLPRAQRALASPAARVAAGTTVRYEMGDSHTPEEKSQIETALGPSYTEQVKATQPGPKGEKPLAQIGGERTPYDPMIAVAARDHQVSPQLMKALFSQESNFNPHATSRKGAKGIAQLMPGTAGDLGVQDPYDATEAIPASTWHFAQLMQRYGGNKSLALAAYNAGPQSVDRYGGIPPYKETQDYVKRVLDKEKSYGGGKEPERQLTWPEIAQRYTQAKRSGDESEWRELRRQINARVKSKLQQPGLGMNRLDYQRFLPIIIEALRPDPEPDNSTTVSG